MRCASCNASCDFMGQLVELHDVNLTQRCQDAKMGNFNHGWRNASIATVNGLTLHNQTVPVL